MKRRAWDRGPGQPLTGVLAAVAAAALLASPACVRKRGVEDAGAGGGASAPPKILADGGVSALADGGAERPAAVVSTTSARTFVPAKVVIHVGQTVRWENPSYLVHTVTADPADAARPGDVKLPEGARPFRSGSLEPGAVFEHTFVVPGLYQYVCQPHELQGMIGQVVVLPEGGSADGGPGGG